MAQNQSPAGMFFKFTQTIWNHFIWQLGSSQYIMPPKEGRRQMHHFDDGTGLVSWVTFEQKKKKNKQIKKGKKYKKRDEKMKGWKTFRGVTFDWFRSKWRLLCFWYRADWNRTSSKLCFSSMDWKLEFFQCYSNRLKSVCYRTCD